MSKINLITNAKNSQPDFQFCSMDLCLYLMFICLNYYSFPFIGACNFYRKCSVALSTHTSLYNHHLYPSLEASTMLQKQPLCPLNSEVHSSRPWPPAATTFFFDSYEFAWLNDLPLTPGVYSKFLNQEKWSLWLHAFKVCLTSGLYISIYILKYHMVPIPEKKNQSWDSDRFFSLSAHNWGTLIHDGLILGVTCLNASYWELPLDVSGRCLQRSLERGWTEAGNLLSNGLWNQKQWKSGEKMLCSLLEQANSSVLGHPKSRFSDLPLQNLSQWLPGFPRSWPLAESCIIGFLGLMSLDLNWDWLLASISP